MRARRGIVLSLIGVLISALMIVSAPAANAASGCFEPLLNFRLHEQIKDGHYVIKNFYSSSHDVSCLIVKRDDGRKMNVILKIERDYVKKGKATTHSQRQFLDVRRVARVFDTDNVWITIQVFAGTASQEALPYRGTTTLLRS